MKTKEKLFPVEYNGKLWTKKECDDIFLAFYIDRICLNDEGGVYATEGLYVYPDGTMEEY